MMDQVLLEFEDNWSKPTESKAPDKPVRVAPPVDKTAMLEEQDDITPPDTPVQPGNQDAAATTQKAEAKLSPALSAEFTTMGIDTIQNIVFSLINNRKIKRRIGAENIERFGALLAELAENKKQPENLSPDDSILFWKFRRLKQVEEDIPLTNEEYDQLNQVLEKYYTETGKSMPAWLGLSIALTQVLGARLSDALTE